MPPIPELVTIGRFDGEPRAELLRGHLLVHGITAVLENAELSTLQSVGVGYGNVLVRVHGADAPVAARLVAEWDREGARLPAGAQGERCLACGAPLAATERRCAGCGWTWEEARPS
jgi:hypothetical protein